MWTYHKVNLNQFQDKQEFKKITNNMHSTTFNISNMFIMTFPEKAYNDNDHDYQPENDYETALKFRRFTCNNKYVSGTFLIFLFSLPTAKINKKSKHFLSLRAF